MLADQVLDSGDRRRAEVSDRAGLLLTHDRDRRHDRRDQAQEQHEDAGHHRVDAEKGLIVPEAGLYIIVPPGVGAARTMKRPLQFLALRPDYPRHVVLRGFATKRHRAIDRRVDLRRPVVEKVATETGRHFDDDLGVPASQPSLGLVRRCNRRLDGKIARSVEALKQIATLGRVVLVE